MTRVQIVALLAAMLVVVMPTGHAATGRHPMTVDDMMKVEGFGTATMDPTGHWLVYERLRPYDQSDDYSFRSYATMGKSGQQLWQYDLTTGSKPRLLSGLDPRPNSYVLGFSPAGHFLTIMQYRFGALSLSAYNMGQERAVRFPETPAFSEDGTYNPVWIAPDELVFAALPKGQWPELTSLRAYTGKTLSKAWEDAWHGKVVTASEVDSPTQDQSAQQEPGSLVRADARTGKTVILAQGLYGDLRVSPDRRYLAALAVSKPGPADPSKLDEADDNLRRYRLTVFDLKTGAASPLAPQVQFLPYSTTWAPDGRHVAAYGWPIAGGNVHEGRYYVVDVQTGAVVRYDHHGLDLADERERGFWPRPERMVFLGDRLAVFARPIPPGEPQAPRFTYRDIRPTHLSTPDWYAVSADGRVTNLTQGLAGVSGVPVHAGKGTLTVVADDGVYRIGADGARRRLTPVLPGHFSYQAPGTFATRAGANRPDFGDEALVRVQGAGAAMVVMVDLRDGHEGQDVVVEALKNNVAPITGSLAAGAVLYRTEDGPVSRLLVATANPKEPPREIARINIPLTKVNLGTWKVVSYSVQVGSRSPQTIESCVLLPPGYTDAAPPPLVVEVYPGVRSNCTSMGPAIAFPPDPHSPYLWVGEGYAYARLTTPDALLRTEDGPIAGMPAVIEAGVQALIDKGYADPHRLALEGISQGGVSALYVAAHTQRFKAIIAMNSWADLFSHYFGPEGVYSYVYGKDFGEFERYDSIAGGDFGIGETPFDAPEIYYRNSPVFLAPKINTPVLLIAADMDEFSMSQFDEMYGAFRRAGKDVHYVRYWGEGHAPSSPANLRDLWKRKINFLIENGVMPYPLQGEAGNGRWALTKEPY